MGKLTYNTAQVQNLLDKIEAYPQSFDAKTVTNAVNIDNDTIKRTPSGVIYVDKSVIGGTGAGSDGEAFDAEGAYTSLSEEVSNNAGRISKVEQDLGVLLGPEYVPPIILTGNAQGVGGYESTERWKMFAGIEAGEKIRIKITADTDVAYSSADNAEHTFVDVVYYPAGTTSPTNIVWENRGNVGDKYLAGATIYEGEYTLPEVADVWLRGRFLGNVTMQITYGGEDNAGIVKEVEGLKATAHNHETRISALEQSGTSNIIELYKHQVARALQLGYVESRSEADWPIKPLVFAHISDTHKATHNLRAFEVLNYLGTNGHVQFLMHTGDILEDPKSASQSRWAGIVASAQYPVMLTAGNHDVGNWATASGQYTTDALFYNAFIAPVRDIWGLKSDGGGTPHINGKNYYFKDFSEQKVRYIVVYEYELPEQFDIDGSTLLAGRGARWISQAQADWFVEALRTTPDGYGVIVAKHAPDGKRGEDSNPFNSPFLKGKEHQQTYQYFGGVSYTTFFADIVQAFIDKTTISKTIQQSAGTITGSVTINADFTTTSGREFICYVTGHTHADGINFLKDYPEQLDLNINCDNTFYQHYSDLYLAEGTMYEDAINVYSIDRNRGVIHVVRIGGEYSADGDRRDILTIKYR